MSACDRAVFPLVMIYMQTTSPLWLGVAVNYLLSLLVLRQTCLDWSATCILFSLRYSGVAEVTGVQSHQPDSELVFCVFESLLVHKPGCLSQGALKHTQESHPSPNLSQGALK